MVTEPDVGRHGGAEGKFITLETLQTRPYLHVFLGNQRAKRTAVSVLSCNCSIPFISAKERKPLTYNIMLAVAALKCPQVNYLEI